jgi:hypothetical protein
MGGSARTFAMMAVAVAAIVAAPYIAPFIEAGLGAIGIDALGTTIALLEVGAAPEIAAGIASAVVPTVGGAVTGAAAGGANAQISGNDPWEGAFTGAVAGGVGGAVSSAVGSALPAGTPGPVAAGVRGAASGFTSAQLRGRDLEESLQTGLISGGTAGLTSALMPAGFLSSGQTAEDYVTDEEGMFVYDAKGNPILTEDAKAAAKLNAFAEKTARGFGSGYIRQNLSGLFADSPKDTTASAPTRGFTSTGLVDRPGFVTSTGSTPSYSRTGTGASYDGGSVASTGQGSQGQPGSQALAQALRIGDPGAAIESPSQGVGEQQSVWNTASLRFKDETGSDA